jgi:hypothetical protein
MQSFLKFSETSVFKRIETLSLDLYSFELATDPPYPLTEFMENVILALSRAENLKELTILNNNQRCFHQEEGPVPFLFVLSQMLPSRPLIISCLVASELRDPFKLD